MPSVLICTRLISNRCSCVLSLCVSLARSGPVSVACQKTKYQGVGNREEQSAHTHILDWIDVARFHFRFIIRSIANDVNFDYILYFNSRFDNIHGDESTYLLAAIARLIFFSTLRSPVFCQRLFVYLPLTDCVVCVCVCVSRSAVSSCACKAK